MEPERGIYVHAEAAERSTPQTSYGRERLQAASVGRRLTDKQLGAYLKRALEATLRTH
jgi:hypothetical protein